MSFNDIYMLDCRARFGIVKLTLIIKPRSWMDIKYEKALLLSSTSKHLKFAC